MQSWCPTFQRLFLIPSSEACDECCVHIFIHRTVVRPSTYHVAKSDQSQMVSDVLSRADCVGNSPVTCIHIVSHWPFLTTFLSSLICFIMFMAGYHEWLTIRGNNISFLKLFCWVYYWNWVVMECYERYNLWFVTSYITHGSFIFILLCLPNLYITLSPCCYILLPAFHKHSQAGINKQQHYSMGQQ
jgi:hypothetical protein